MQPENNNRRKFQRKLTRNEKAQKIAWTRGAIRRVDDNTYLVQSQSGNGEYIVVATESGWSCQCKDQTFRPSFKCKHILSVEISLELRKAIEPHVTVISEVNAQSCRFCSSVNIVRDGVRKNKFGDIQRYKCRDCKHFFTINIGFEKMHATPQMITTAMQLYFSGESLRSVQKFLQLQGLKISHVAVLKWIKKYVALMQRYLDNIVPNLSNTWRTDEIYLKVKGNTKYLYALMDDQSRFWIAQQLADSKYTQDVTPMFREGKAVGCKIPNNLISDGATNFHVAWKREYAKAPKTKHIRHVHLQGDRNNNKMERLNGEIRDREKVMRGLKVLLTYRLINPFLPHEKNSISRQVNNAPLSVCIVMASETFWGLISITLAIAGGLFALLLEMRKGRGEISTMTNFLRDTNASTVDGKIAMIYAYALDAPRWDPADPRSNLMMSRIISDLNSVGRIRGSMTWDQWVELHRALTQLINVLRTKGFNVDDLDAMREALR